MSAECTAGFFDDLVATWRGSRTPGWPVMLGLVGWAESRASITGQAGLSPTASCLMPLFFAARTEKLSEQPKSTVLCLTCDHGSVERPISCCSYSNDDCTTSSGIRPISRALSDTQHISFPFPPISVLLCVISHLCRQSHLHAPPLNKDQVIAKSAVVFTICQAL